MEANRYGRPIDITQNSMSRKQDESLGTTVDNEPEPARGVGNLARMFEQRAALNGGSAPPISALKGKPAQTSYLGRAPHPRPQSQALTLANTLNRPDAPVSSATRLSFAPTSIPAQSTSTQLTPTTFSALHSSAVASKVTPLSIQAPSSVIGPIPTSMAPSPVGLTSPQLHIELSTASPSFADPFPAVSSARSSVYSISQSSIKRGPPPPKPRKPALHRSSKLPSVASSLGEYGASNVDFAATSPFAERSPGPFSGLAPTSGHAVQSIPSTRMSLALQSHSAPPTRPVSVAQPSYSSSYLRQGAVDQQSKPSLSSRRLSKLTEESHPLFPSPTRPMPSLIPTQSMKQLSVPNMALLPSYSDSDKQPMGSDASNTDTALEASTKRDHIIRELIDTEATYLRDMKLLDELYFAPAVEQKLFSSLDTKNLFSNLHAIIQVSEKFLLALSDAPDCVGRVLNMMLPGIEKQYCIFCKNHDAAMNKILEFKQPDTPAAIKDFLASRHALLAGRTGAWDLGSLVIKPVQRVLKYPLLIKSLLKETPPTHPDFDSLVSAYTLIELVAEKINEVKKRKEVVEKYVDGKSPANVMHGITKKITRGAQQLKIATGLSDDMPIDEKYMRLALLVDSQLKGFNSLEAEVLAWMKKMHDYFELVETFSVGLEEVFYFEADRAGGNGRHRTTLHAVTGYRQSALRITAGPWKVCEQAIQESVIPSIHKLVSSFRSPLILMKKRENKFLDYDRAKAVEAKGEAMDKLLQESADTYELINDQLIEELPTLLSLSSTCISHIVAQLAMLQSKLYASILPMLDGILELFDAPLGDVLEGARQFTAPGGTMDVLTKDFALLSRWRESMWSGGVFSYSGDNLLGSKSNLDGVSRQSSTNSIALRPTSRLLTSQSQHSLGGTGRRRSVSLDSYTAPIILSTHGKNNPTPHDTGGQPPPPLSNRPSFFTDSSHQPAPVRSAATSMYLCDIPVLVPIPARPPSRFEVNATKGNMASARALFAFSAELPDEVSLTDGCMVQVDQFGGRDGCDAEHYGDWWHGRVLDGPSSGQAGWFPSNHVSNLL